MRISKAVAVALLIAFSASTTPAVSASSNFGPETLALINSYRASRGLSPLTSNAALKALARQHSRYQASRNRLSHDGFRERSAKAKAAGLSVVCAENSGHNYKSPKQLFMGWRNSAAHRKNMLRPNLRYAGVSVVGAYATFFACQ
jgi:uncharacterized protein YkwD